MQLTILIEKCEIDSVIITTSVVAQDSINADLYIDLLSHRNETKYQNRYYTRPIKLCSIIAKKV